MPAVRRARARRILAPESIQELRHVFRRELRGRITNLQGPRLRAPAPGDPHRTARGRMIDGRWRKDSLRSRAATPHGPVGVNRTSIDLPTALHDTWRAYAEGTAAKRRTQEWRVTMGIETCSVRRRRRPTPYRVIGAAPRSAAPIAWHSRRSCERGRQCRFAAAYRPLANSFTYRAASCPSSPWSESRET